MPYIQVTGHGRVYAMEPGDRVLRGGGVESASRGVIISGKCADGERVAAWERDGLIEKAKPAKKKSKKEG